MTDAAESPKEGGRLIPVTVVFILTDGCGRVAMHKRGPDSSDEHGTWDFGAGKVRYSENIHEALRRECREEWGVRPMNASPLEPYSLFRETSPGVRIHHIGLPFVIRTASHLPVVMEPGKHTEAHWFPVDGLPEPLHPAVAQFTAMSARYWIRRDMEEGAASGRVRMYIRRTHPILPLVGEWREP